MAKTILNRALIKQAVLAAQANSRQSTSHTKTRGEVSGGGKKPWRQKGTGRARAGSNRSPIWVGGGITFGPQKERNYKQRFPKKMAKAAMEQLLSYLNDEKQITVEPNLELAEVKTKKVIELLAKHQLTDKKVLFITGKIEPELVLSARNIPGVAVIENRNLSILDLTKSENLIMDQTSAEQRGFATKAPIVKTASKTTKKPTAKKVAKS